MFDLLDLFLICEERMVNTLAIVNSMFKCSVFHSVFQSSVPFNNTPPTSGGSFDCPLTGMSILDEIGSHDTYHDLKSYI